MAGQLWGGTIPGAQSFLRSFIGASQPEGFEQESTRPTEAPAVKSAGSGQNDSTIPSIDTDLVIREGPPQKTEQVATNHVTDALDSSDLPAWKQKIIDKNEANKKEINGIGDDFTNKAIDRIENMPAERRDKAAEEYLRSD